MKIQQFISNNFVLVAVVTGLIIFLLVVEVAFADKQSSSDINMYSRNQYRMHTNENRGGQGMQRGRNQEPNQYQHQQQVAPSGKELNNQAKDTLYKALDDEYKARATYQAVINKLGNVRPFSMIINAEDKHISYLTTLFNYYKLDVPANPYVNVEVKDTLADNCSIGVQAETDNASLYRNQLLPAVTEYPDITATFTNLMNASQQKHLPAFSRCAN